MTDQDFASQADAALAELNRRLTAACDQHGFDVDFNAGALTVEFDGPPARFVVSPNAPAQQIWVSAHSKSYKFSWDPARAAFTLNGQTLPEMLAEAISRQLGEPVTL